jgi:pimeloyl-ACP methyl ester carboxylesterase
MSTNRTLRTSEAAARIADAAARDAVRASHAHPFDDDLVRPFVLAVPQADLDELAARLDHTRMPHAPAAPDWQRGIPASRIGELIDRWRTSYDWRSREATINAYPQFTTTIDGAAIHFLHVRSAEPDATPLLLTHGWPSTVLEFEQILGPLTDPSAHGLDPASAFHVIAPSMPNFPLSGPADETGWSQPRIADAFASLMDRLGYDQYVAHGGDVGSGVTRDLAMRHPTHVLGGHVLQLWSFPSGDQEELATLTPDDFERLNGAEHFMAEFSGYMQLQNRRPQTLAYALADSPVAQLAWLADFAEAFGDNPGAYDADGLLTAATLYWLSKTGGASAHTYYDDVHPQRENGVCETPIGVLTFPGDFRSVRTLAERDNANIVQWTDAPTGGHFGALMEPALVVDELRAFAGIVAG